MKKKKKTKNNIQINYGFNLYFSQGSDLEYYLKKKQNPEKALIAWANDLEKNVKKIRELVNLFKNKDLRIYTHTHLIKIDGDKETLELAVKKKIIEKYEFDNGKIYDISKHKDDKKILIKKSKNKLLDINKKIEKEIETNQDLNNLLSPLQNIALAYRFLSRKMILEKEVKIKKTYKTRSYEYCVNFLLNGIKILLEKIDIDIPPGLFLEAICFDGESNKEKLLQLYGEKSIKIEFEDINIPSLEILNTICNHERNKKSLSRFEQEFDNIFDIIKNFAYSFLFICFKINDIKYSEDFFDMHQIIAGFYLLGIKKIFEYYGYDISPSLFFVELLKCLGTPKKEIKAFSDDFIKECF